MAISQIKKEALSDWVILKGTSILVLTGDFLGAFNGLVGTYTFDIGVISAVVVMMFADVLSGMYKALKTASFDGKRLGNGIFRKILKYGIIIIVMIQLMSLTYKGEPVEGLQKMAFLFYVGIIGIELDSICGNVFGVKFSQVLNKGIKTLSKIKEATKPE